MQLSIKVDTAAVEAAMTKAASQVPYALSVAINKAAAKGLLAAKAEMTAVFDRPTPWALNSLRIKYATKTKPVASVGFKDKNSAESSRTMIAPHVDSGPRQYKAMEVRLLRAGLLPAGWNAVPGAAAQRDGFGNMSSGQITQILNVLGTYTEAGYNKANANTVKRLAKGSAKKNQYGFTYWVNPVGSTKGRHLQPGVYQRVVTGFGTSLKPVLIFVPRANYKRTLQFYPVVQAVVDKEFPAEFEAAFTEALRTAIPKSQGSLL